MAKSSGKKRNGAAAAVPDGNAALTKKTARKIRKLESKLDGARRTEAKRVKQLAKAQASKGPKAVARRRKQAAESAAAVVFLAGRIAKRTGRSAGGLVEKAGAPRPAATRPAATTRKPAATRPAATTRKPAATS